MPKSAPSGFASTLLPVGTASVLDPRVSAEAGVRGGHWGAQGFWPGPVCLCEVSSRMNRASGRP
eukprot:3387471-Lingulodinium_polyedra.AAC.1